MSTSTTPSVEADAGVGIGIDNPGLSTKRTVYQGSIAGTTENFYFEVDYIGNGSAVANVPVIGYFDFAGTASCNGQFNAFGVGSGPNAGGTGFVVNAGGCIGQFSDTWMEPDAEQVHGLIEAGSDSNGDTIGETALASVQLAIDPNVCDTLWQQAGAPSCSSQLGSIHFTADSGPDTNPADYVISYSSNLVSGAPEPGTIGLGLTGVSLLLLRFRRFRTSRPARSVGGGLVQ